MENHRHRPMGLSLLQKFVKLAPPTDKVIRTEDDIRRSDLMEGNASHQLKKGPRLVDAGTALPCEVQRRPGTDREAILTIRHGVLAQHAGSGPVSQLLGAVAALLEASGSGQRSRCVCFYRRFRFPLDSSFCSQLRGRTVIDRGKAPDSCGHALVVSGPSPTRHNFDQRWHQANVSRPADHNNTASPPLKGFSLPGFLKTPLRGIGLCNGHDTVFPYKWTSSTYSRHQQFWLYSSVMRHVFSPCNWPPVGPP